MAAPSSPGWYPAPDGKGGDQWWNGAGWSETRRNADGSTPGLPGYQAAPPAAPVPAAPAPLGAPNPYAAVPASAPTGRTITSNPGLTALIFGLIGIFAFGPLGIAAIVLGVVALRKAGPTGAGRGMALAAIVLGAIGVVIGIVGFFAGFASILFQY